MSFGVWLSGFAINLAFHSLTAAALVNGSMVEDNVTLHFRQETLDYSLNRNGIGSDMQRDIGEAVRPSLVYGSRT